MRKKKVEQAAAPRPASAIITNCHFTGVRWDARAVEAINTVATALCNLTLLFKAQGALPMISVGVEGVRLSGNRTEGIK